MTEQQVPICRTTIRRFGITLTSKEVFTMRLTSALTRGLVLPLVLLSFLAAAPLAQAANTDHSGTICQNYHAADVSFIDYYSYGTRSLKNAATAVVCPLTRNTSNSSGAHIEVDITHFNSTQTTSCSAFSFNDGSLLASASQSWTGSGWHLFYLDLSGAGKSASTSNYSVICTIPGNGNGLVIDVDLVEN